MPNLPDDNCSGWKVWIRGHTKLYLSQNPNFGSQKGPCRALAARLARGLFRGYRPVGLPAGLRDCDHLFPRCRFSYFFFQRVRMQSLGTVLPVPSDCILALVHAGSRHNGARSCTHQVLAVLLLGGACVCAGLDFTCFPRGAQTYTWKCQATIFTIFPLRMSSFPRVATTKRDLGIKI